MTNQKEAVYNAVTNILNENGIELEVGEKAAEHLTTEQKKVVHQVVFEGIRSNEVAFTKDYADDDKQLNSYVSGLVNNWLRKDKRLNGGEKYKAKNPGSRAGSGDSQIKELRKLLKVEGLTEEQTVKVQAAIKARLLEIKPDTQAVINVDALPEHLRDLVKTTEEA